MGKGLEVGTLEVGSEVRLYVNDIVLANVVGGRLVEVFAGEVEAVFDALAVGFSDQKHVIAQACNLKITGFGDGL